MALRFLRRDLTKYKRPARIKAKMVESTRNMLRANVEISISEAKCTTGKIWRWKVRKAQSRMKS